MVSFSSEEIAKREYFLKPLNSAEELKNWIYVYLDIILPFGNISGFTEDPSSDIIYASPGEAIWIAYNTYKEDRYKENPGYIWLGSRDSAKTLAGSILNVLLLAHFKAEIAHLAAVKKQAEKCIEYTNTFMRKIKPYLEYHGRKITGDSKTKIQVLNEDESVSYIDVVVANLAGGNSQRSTVGTYDELDTLSKEGYKGYKESLLIPTRKNNRGPLRIKFSTRKFVFGFFEKEIQERHKTKEKLIQWNILDIAEKCPDERSLESLGEKHIRYIKKKLPLKIYTEEEVNQMPETERIEVKQVLLHKGCLSCPLASICQGHLTKRKDDEKPGIGSVYKDIDFVIGRFSDISEEMAESQILCWKPTTSGVIYARFSDALGDNVLTIDQAYELATGEKVTNSSLEEFINALHNMDAEIYAGVDFGFTNHSVIVILARISTGYSFILDTYSMPGLETHDFAEIALQYQEKYKVKKWFCDNAAPAAIKTFQKKGLRCPDFKKDIQGGIDAIRSQIITPKGLRLLKVIKTKENEQILTMFKEHHFLLDIAGNVTKNPDDTAGIADIADALRYIGQNIFQAKRRQGSILVATKNDFTQKNDKLISSNDELKAKAGEINRFLMSSEIAKRTESNSVDSKDNTIKKNKKIFWSMD